MTDTTRSTIINIIVLVILTAILCFELCFSYKQIRAIVSARTDTYTEASKMAGTKSVSVAPLSTYPRLVVPGNGAVVEFDHVADHIRVNGSLDTSVSSSYGAASYVSFDTDAPETISYHLMTDNVQEMLNVMSKYWKGEPEALVKYYAIDVNGDTPMYYQDTTMSGNVPVVYMPTAETYYMFIPYAESVCIISCKEPFVITSDGVTVAYEDPASNPMTYPVYSDYENTAIKNTINKIKSGEDDDGKDSDSDSNYDDDANSNGTFTAPVDDKIRDGLAAYINYTFTEDGQSNKDGIQIDLTSNDALSSKLVLTTDKDIAYSYTKDGLSLYNIKAEASTSYFNLSGNIENLLDAERPCVIVVKYLDADNKLLGISVIDSRKYPIEAKGVAKFTTSASAKKNGVNPAKVKALMFEVH